MLKHDNTTNWVRPCDTCHSAVAAVYCRADLAYLCAACDADIHSANPLARRHHRVPITPISGINEYEGLLTNEEDDLTLINGDDEEEAASWLLLNPIKNGDDNETNDVNKALFGGELDEFLDLDDYNSCQNNNNQFNEGFNNINQKQEISDCVVPIQHQCYQLGLSYPASMSQSVSHSSMEIGVVPQSTSEPSISISHTRPPKGTIDLFSSPVVESPTQLSSIDREARVMRYREKKKNRKFEKTIRYASRKAYSETRPRIKGRFAKRRDADEVEVDQMFCESLMVDSGYGLVPSSF